MKYLIFLFIIILFCESRSTTYEPRKPYWNDFQASFVFRTEVWADPWKSVGDIYYKGSAKKMRVDYWGMCLPYFNFSDLHYDCTYIFIDGYTFYRSEEKGHCCWFEQMPVIPPTVFNNTDYVGVEIYNGMVCNKWVHKDGEPWMEYLAEVGSYNPVSFHGTNYYLGHGKLDWIFVDQSSELEDDLYYVDPKCYVQCPWKVNG